MTQHLLQAGTTNFVEAEFIHESGYPFNLQGCDVWFTLTDYVDLTGSPLLRVKADILSNGEKYDLARAILPPADTKDMYGKYRYRFTVVDGNKHIDAITGDLMMEICTDKEAIV